MRGLKPVRETRLTTSVASYRNSDPIVAPAQQLMKPWCAPCLTGLITYSGIGLENPW